MKERWLIYIRQLTSLLTMSKPPLQIAIDGPVAAGKGDIAEHLARKIGAIYLYTGAMYRALALACIQTHTDPANAELVKALLLQLNIDLLPAIPGKQQAFKILLNSEDVTERIFASDVATIVPEVSKHKDVRKIMVNRQQRLTQGKRVVMEGRDIGKRVLPQAQLKIFLTAILEERATRRLKQFKLKGINKSFEEVLAETKHRDEQDMKRDTDPLEKHTDAWELDTTNLTQEQVVESIVVELKKRHLL